MTTKAAEVPDEMKPIGEVHKELIAEADAQAKFNADQHALQVEQNKKFHDLLAKNQPVPIEADEARADAMDAQKAEATQRAEPHPAKPAAKPTPPTQK